MEFDDWISLIERFGVLVVLLVLILYTGYKRVWVWGYQLRDCETERKEWKDLALTGTKIAETVAASRQEELKRALKDLLEKNDS